jgi:hypothetical protein
MREEGTDCHVVDKGYASLSPMRLDTTYHEFLLDLIEEWGNPVMKTGKR